jgi:uncharacterized tellurite resistance protein B-like protein
MVSDGRASRAEKLRIHELLTRLKVPWHSDQVEARIAAFIQDVKDNGFKAVLDRTCEDARVFKQLGRERILRDCMVAMSSADGETTDKEKDVCRRIMDALR